MANRVAEPRPASYSGRGRLIRSRQAPSPHSQTYASGTPSSSGAPPRMSSIHSLRARAPPPSPEAQTADPRGAVHERALAEVHDHVAVSRLADHLVQRGNGHHIEPAGQTQPGGPGATAHT